MNLSRVSITRNTTRNVVLLGIALAGSGYCLVSLAKRATVAQRELAEQKVYFDQPAFDFGTIRQSQKIAHDFRLINRSGEECRVIGVHSTCSCTVITGSLVGKVLPPDGEILVPVEYDSGNREGEASAVATVLLESRETTYAVEATLRGRILPEFTMTPDALDFGEVEPGKEATQTVSFRLHGADRLAIEGGHSNHPAFQFSLPMEREITSHSAELRLAVTFRAPNLTQRQMVSGIVSLATSNERARNVKIFVRGRVCPDAEIAPDVIVRSAGSSLRENRFTITTALSSRVDGVYAERDASEQPLPLEGVATSTNWQQTHQFTVPMRALDGARRIKFVLSMRDNAGRVTTRNLFVVVTNLN